MAQKPGRGSRAKEAREDLKERESMPINASALRERVDEQTNQSPAISGGDVDAAWDRADMAGEETVGGSVATPDQDRVDEIGAAAGLTYQDDEPLNYNGKMRKRDEQRWELNPASAAEGEHVEGWSDLKDEPTLVVEDEEDLEDELEDEDLDDEDDEDEDEGVAEAAPEGDLEDDDPEEFDEDDEDDDADADDDEDEDEVER
jgi:hypothetical protein